MSIWLMEQLEYLLRILIAASCGAAIGYERENRLKTAGIRTHMIVSIGAVLMMIISKYGFDDILGNIGTRLDPSRIGASIVSAIGFLGAGVIFIRKQTVSGLTTAAGVWATVGIGMAIGCGMYLLAIASTLLIIAVQIVLHKHLNIIRTPISEKIVLIVENTNSAIPSVIKEFDNDKIEIIKTSIKRVNNSEIEVRLSVRFPDGYQLEDTLQMVRKYPNIKSIER